MTKANVRGVSLRHPVYLPDDFFVERLRTVTWPAILTRDEWRHVSSSRVYRLFTPVNYRELPAAGVKCKASHAKSTRSQTLNNPRGRK